MKNIFLLTGSNIGESKKHLEDANALIMDRIGVVVKKSSIYKTEPWGNREQQDFLNQVLEVQTEVTADEVLKRILGIEQEMGRNRLQKWEPRIIDIDILFYGDTIIQSENLVIPHPLLHERRFTLLPLAEIASDVVHPVLDKTIADLLKECSDKSSVMLAIQ